MSRNGLSFGHLDLHSISVPFVIVRTWPFVTFASYSTDLYDKTIQLNTLASEALIFFLACKVRCHVEEILQSLRRLIL